MSKRKNRGRSTVRVVSDYYKNRTHSTGWTVEPEEPLANCSYIKKTYLLLAPQVIIKCHALMILAGTDEWLGYLAISKEENEHQLIYTAHDLIIPWQEVSGTSVHVCAYPARDNENIMAATNGKVYLGGVVHSHHNMNIKFSGTDHEFINRNNEVSLLLAHSFGFHAEAITTTLCGKKAKQVIQVVPFTKDKITIFNNLEENFRDRIRNVTKITGYVSGWGYSYPSEKKAGEPIVDVISLTNERGVVEVIDLDGGEVNGDDNHGDSSGENQPTADRAEETVVQGGH